MRETPLSNCERQFLLKAIEEKKRLDGRQTYDYRNIKITFGTDYGCCIVDLGKTRVLAQVSCELVAPKENRPTEGILFLSLELSPMASPIFEAGRQSELLVKLNRLLERCLRNSKCIDTESLCVVSGEKVWQIRVDVHVLNHEGNLMDAASIAAIAGLCHFRRPDVGIQGDEVTVYGPEERDPVPLSIYHMPICVSFAFFLEGTYLLVDPSEREERVMDGLLVIAMNKHREICSIQSSGGIMLLKDQVLRCSKIASVKVSEITDLINRALENDRKARKEGDKFGFAELMAVQRITALKSDEVSIEMSDGDAGAPSVAITTESPPEVERVPSPVVRAPGAGQVGESLENAWGLEQLEEEEDQPGDEVMDEGLEIKEENQRQEKSKGEVVVISDSEEEEVVILNPKTQVKESTLHASQSQPQSTGAAKKKKKQQKKKPVH
ncbi:exosome complex component RRP45 [Anguilla anguilla]|uniref:exosome complex component RRP45 n=1 Tax=Anguilla anguilla TaxID=7936 RepID=UPI0015AE92EF|nr:exosome complex component RRP45 [Anguilla anguilla]